MISIPFLGTLVLFWIAVTGSATVANIILGLVLATLCIYFVREHSGAPTGRRRFVPIALLAVIFAREIVVSAWTVAKLVLSPKMHIQPGIFAYPLTVDSDLEITLLANMITLTPGTLSVDVSPDRKLLYVHAIDCSDVDKTIGDIERVFERRILRAFR